MTKAQIEKLKMLRGELTKVRCWLSGFEVGTGKYPPGNDGLRQMIILIDELVGRSKP